MARKKLPPYLTEGMTVSQIINMSSEAINRMSTRDLSRAVRTISLAANKRLTRLEAHANISVSKMGDISISERNNRLGLDFEALHAVGVDASGKINRFGVGRGRNIDTLRKEFARVRNFLNAGSTTITGAVQLRKQREKAVFGATREEIIQRENVKRAAAGKGRMSAKEIADKLSEMKDITGEVYSQLHKFNETYPNQGRYDPVAGRRVVRMLQRRIAKGMTPEQARQSVERYYDKQYEKKKAFEAAAEENPLDSMYNSLEGNPFD